MIFLTILSIVFIVSGNEAQYLLNTRDRRSDGLPINGDDGFETEDPTDRLTTTTNAMEREREVGNVPSTILNATLKAKGKYLAKIDDEDLKAALGVFSLLNNATDESFADTFIKIATDKLVSALKGVRIVASFASGHSKAQDEGTANILRNITEGLEKLSDKVLCKSDIIYIPKDKGRMQFLAEIGLNLTEEEKKRPDMKLKLDNEVVVPVNSTSSSMIAYLKENTSENKEQFLKCFKELGVYYYVAQYVVRSAFENVRNVIDVSEFDITKVDQMRSKFSRYLFQIYILAYFNGGLKGEKETESQSLLGIFSIQMEEIKDNLKRASNYYDDIFFPIYLKQTIMKSELEYSGRNNCDLAQGIVDKLKSKCARHKYVVIVSDAVSTPDQYAYYGYQDRMAIKEEYNGKSVVAFMATTKNWKNEEAFYAHWSGMTIQMDVFDKYNTNNLHTLMDFGKDRDDYQTAVFKDRYNPCLRSDSKHASYTSKIDISRELGILGSDLIYFVVY